MAILEFNEDESNRLLGIYVTSDIKAQRVEFINSINFEPGEKVLDVGTGPGFLARDIAKRVGNNGIVHGVDVSEFLLKIARNQHSDIENIKFEHGNACDLDYSDEEFDTVVCTQVLEYVNDVDDALKEFYRVLRKGGKIALLDTDWDSIVWHSTNRTRMNRILTEWEAHASDPFLPRTLLEKLKIQGFNIESNKIITIYNPHFKIQSYSNLLIDLIVPFVVQRGNISKEEADSWATELRRNGNSGKYFFSLNRYFFLASKF